MLYKDIKVMIDYIYPNSRFLNISVPRWTSNSIPKLILFQGFLYYDLLFWEKCKFISKGEENKEEENTFSIE